jgi:hypothetical protein
VEDSQCIATYILFYFICMAFLCVYPGINKGSSKTPQKRFGESPCQKPLAKKVEKLFFLSSFPFDLFFIAFLAVFLHEDRLNEEAKNTIKIFSEIRPTISNNLKINTMAPTSLSFVLFLRRSAPLANTPKRGAGKTKQNDRTAGHRTRRP